MFDSVCETVKSQVPVDDLKRYLCRTFSEFQILLQDAVTTDDVMEAVRNESSLTDFAYFEENKSSVVLEIMTAYSTHSVNKLLTITHMSDHFARTILDTFYPLTK